MQAKKGKALEIGSKEIENGIKACEKSLIGKIIGEKIFNFNG